MITRIISCALSFCIITVSPVWSSAQTLEDASVAETASSEPRGPQLDKAVVKRWRVGVEIDAARGGVNNILVTLPVPREWPEQKVRKITEDISANVGPLRSRNLEDGVEQLLVRVPRLRRGQQAQAVITYEVSIYTRTAPEDVDVYTIPDRRKVPRQVQRYLNTSPYIEVSHPKVRVALRKIVNEKQTAWQQVRAIYDFVRERVEYKEGELKGAVAALNDEFGDCEAMTCLFVALCRKNQVPARMVWVVDHAYPEFFLLDENGNGYWFPCQVAGTEAFGSMPDARPILQKGDNFKVPEKKGRQHYVSEYLTAKPARGSPGPDVKFIRHYVDDRS